MPEAMIVEGLLFHHVITCTGVEGADTADPIVTYTFHVDHPDSLERGIYVIEVDDIIAYVGAFYDGLRDVWFEPLRGRLDHPMAGRIARALSRGMTVHVYAATEDEMRQYMKAAAHDSYGWRNTYGNEYALINHLRPGWNDLDIIQTE
jgi:hypothetical protein